MQNRYASWGLAALLAALTLAGCSVGAPAPEPGTAVPASQSTPAQALPDAFVNRVWQVTESEQVAIGDLRVFLSDGTLVMTSAHARPAFGSWIFEAGRLTIIEEGQRYATDILDLSTQTFRIRMHSPGEPVVIRFSPAPPTAAASAAVPAK